MAKKKVGIVVGSIRTGSFTRMVAEAMCGLHSDLDCQILEIKQLSMFNQDLEKTPPQDWLDFKAKIKACDAILFATPEYNRSIPGVLKNAIDVGIAAPTAERVVEEAVRGRERLAGRARRLRRQPPPAPVPRVPRDARAADGDVHRPRLEALRRQGQPHQRGHAALPEEDDRRLRGVDRDERGEGLTARR
jgi:hypothetical protein